MRLRRELHASSYSRRIRPKDANKSLPLDQWSQDIIPRALPAEYAPPHHNPAATSNAAAKKRRTGNPYNRLFQRVLPVRTAGVTSATVIDNVSILRGVLGREVRILAQPATCALGRNDRLAL